VNWNVLIRSPLVYSSSQDFMLTSLFVNCFVDDINEELYDAALVGLEYTIQAQPIGIFVYSMFLKFANAA
jgi:secreted Zn-dependent insulinase-like peptidase